MYCLRFEGHESLHPWRVMGKLKVSRLGNKVSEVAHQMVLHHVHMMNEERLTTVVVWRAAADCPVVFHFCLYTTYPHTRCCVLPFLIVIVK